MISAKEARRESEKFHEYEVEDQMKRIEEKIKLAASLGYTQYTWGGSMYVANKVNLVGAGYLIVEAPYKTAIYW